ncbi:MAG: NAD-dependent epimerase/dehydratase family protein [Candidatus Magasanikbacteria bacterium GW2011_GWA2_56_11]|uniref:NAD-dependent epimerase/dehydratase family protein n=1 Tax=Candidatus Magasanikbacteria bacterium GW2011_GWA2_56_11 TaxID=1619044 RepID=A0A0G1YGK5_9BACT|nr:MAG: NAD-dependent epimerase/dehydratase family protein [Candidatus Magasanikbacteria bacterium GW2011_GWA2_56_11]
MDAVSRYRHILVTGGAGFIGSHVVDDLLEAGYRVRVLDALLPPAHNGVMPPWCNSGAEFMLGDVRRKSDWQPALEGIDAVIHLAAYMDYHLDFTTYIETNTASITNLFEVIVENQLPVKKIIAASSQSVYGEGKYSCPDHGEAYLLPRSEEALARHDWEQHCPVCAAVAAPVPEREGDRLVPLIPYGVSKQSAEQLLECLGAIYQIPTVSLRYSIALGPRQSFRHCYSGALRSFALNVLRGEPVQMNEDGGQLRDFVHVADVARAHRVVLEDEWANGQVFNVGLGTGTRVIDLARMTAAAAGVPFQPLLTNRYRLQGARHSLMDTGRLRALGWGPVHTVDEAAAEYVAWIKPWIEEGADTNQIYQEMRQAGIVRDF